MSVPFLPKNPTFNEQLGSALGGLLGGGLSSGAQGFMDKRTDLADQRILQSLGPNASALDFIKATGQLSQRGQQNLSPLFSHLVQTQSQPKSEKQIEKEEGIEGAQQILKRQREILKKGNLGAKIGSTEGGIVQGPRFFRAFSKEGQKDRAEYKRLGKSLISYSSSIPIRNRQEFETLAAELYDESLPDPQIEGILDAMERIVGVHAKNLPGEKSSDDSKAKPSLESYYQQ